MTESPNKAAPDVWLPPEPSPDACLQHRLNMILPMHKEGKSAREISRVTGIPNTTVRRHLQKLAKDPTNGIRAQHLDNNNCNLSWQKQIQNGKWFKIIQHIRDVDLPFYESEGFKPMLRTLLYRLDSLKLLDKTKDYKSLIRYTVRAREFSIYCPPEWDFYPKLPIDCFEDRQSGREVLEEYDDSPPRQPIPPEDPQDPEEYIEDAIEELKYAPFNYDGEGRCGIQGIPPGKWYGQPKYVEAWLEEAGLSVKFKKILQGRCVNIVLNHGFSSLTFAYKNCRRLQKIADRHPDKKIHILYFGDLDIYGEDMDRQIQEWLELFGIDDIVTFQRVALTIDQVTKYHIQERDLSSEDIEYLEKNDRYRYANFVTKYGRVFKVELNAMMINKRLLSAFEKIVQESVDAFWDEEIYIQNCPRQIDLQSKNIDPDSEWKQSGLTIREMMFTKINDAFYPGWLSDFRNSMDNDDNYS
jgi:hypothetical protein